MRRLRRRRVGSGLIRRRGILLLSRGSRITLSGTAFHRDEGESYHAKEQILQINRLPTPRNPLHQSRNMPLINQHISNLIPRKIRPQQRPRMLPFTPIRRENPIPQQGPHSPIAVIAQLKVLKFERQDGLHVLRFHREDDAPADHGRFEGYPVCSVPGADVFQEAVFFRGGEHLGYHS